MLMNGNVRFIVSTWIYGRIIMTRWSPNVYTSTQVKDHRQRNRWLNVYGFVYTIKRSLKLATVRRPQKHSLEAESQRLMSNFPRGACPLNGYCMHGSCRLSLSPSLRRASTTTHQAVLWKWYIIITVHLLTLLYYMTCTCSYYIAQSRQPTTKWSIIDVI